jgi:hypothetical protein
MSTRPVCPAPSGASATKPPVSASSDKRSQSPPYERDVTALITSAKCSRVGTGAKSANQT